jgi:hypothetical protein
VKHRTFSKSAFAVTAVLFAIAAAACANSADVPAEEVQQQPTEPAPATTLPPQSKPTPPAPPEKKCAATCKTDSDCANTCPPLAGGVQCCDTKTNVCWGSKTSSCPQPEADAGDPPPAY